MKDYEAGEAVIVGCMGEIVDFVHRVFQQLKAEYRRICDYCWRTENTTAIREL